MWKSECARPPRLRGSRWRAGNAELKKWRKAPPFAFQASEGRQGARTEKMVFEFQPCLWGRSA